MYVLLRLARVVVAGLARAGTLEPLGESVVRFRVWPNDLDTNWHMNNGRYLTLMDLGRFDLVARTGLMRALVRNGWRPLVGAATVRFLRSLSPFQRYELKSRILGWDEKWFYFEQRFERAGQAVAVGWVKGLLRGRDGNVAPRDVVAAVGQSPKSPPLPPEVRALGGPVGS